MKNFALCVTVFICFATSPQLYAADHGLFMVVKGNVKVISGKDKSQATAKVGSKVFSGDTVVTEKDARAKIVMADRNVLQLSPDTKFEITNYKTSAVESERTAQLALIQGKVRATVEQKYGEKNEFQLKTPTAVAGVRGTQYVAQYNPATSVTSLMVMSGKVRVSPLSGGAVPVMVTPNQGVNVGSQATKLETFAVSKDQMSSFSNMSETKNLDTIQQEAPAAPAAPSESMPKEDSGDNRAPSSESTPVRMVTSEDHGGKAVENPKNAPPPAPPLTQLPTQAPVVRATPVPIPDKAKETIQNQSSKTKVIVTPKPQP